MACFTKCINFIFNLMWKKKTLLQAFSRKCTFLLETNYSYIFQESIIYTRERRKL